METYFDNAVKYLMVLPTRYNEGYLHIWPADYNDDVDITSGCKENLFIWIFPPRAESFKAQVRNRLTSFAKAYLITW